MPTVKCLTNLIDMPFFVITLKEIEVAHFERVAYNLKNFDLCFIFKDYHRPVLRVSAIPTTFIDTIKSWLDEMNIVYSQGPNSFNWKTLMKRINADPKSFIDEGSWGWL